MKRALLTIWMLAMAIGPVAAHADQIFVFAGHTYKIITQPASWNAASIAAAKMQVAGHTGYLARVDSERENRAIAAAICAAVGSDESLIQPVRDRPAHDRRYAIDPSKARALGFDPGPPIEERMPEIVEWYRSHRGWWERIKAGEYQSYYARTYGGREV